jgi:glucokinase
MGSEDTVLVGDVGGTHARFAIVDVSGSGPGRVLHRLDLEQEFPSLIAALCDYIKHCRELPIPTIASIAVAGPVTAGKARLTNRDWEISEKALQEFGFREALLINDFAALAFAIDLLTENDLHRIGPQFAGLPGAPITILGPGTGFGVCCLARFGDHIIPLATEGGHVAFAPGNEREMGILRCLWKKHGRVSIERVLSGPGLENLYGALQQLEGRPDVAMSATRIADRAAGGDARCREALGMFCSVLGSVAGDFALAHGAAGGVYIAGGIGQKIQGFLEQSDFRASFESKGRLSAFVKSIPTKLIVNGDAALLGAARAGLRRIIASGRPEAGRRPDSALSRAIHERQNEP